MGRTRRQLARELSRELRISEAVAMRIMARLFRKLSEDLVRTGRVELRGFGSFKTVQRPAQTLRSPKTGQPVQVPPYRTVAFRAGEALRRRLSGGTPTPAPDSEGESTEE